MVDEHRVFFEQFIRQSMDMKSRPVIAFTTSDMPNWNKTVCKNNEKRQDKTEEEETVLKAFDAGKNVKRAAALPKFEISDNFASVLEMFQSYRMSGKGHNSH
jgi:hypothetical protein